MAILYGTQSNGETLPVLVDQFGNLLAKGIEGPPGNDGEPGGEGPQGPQGDPGEGVPLPYGEEGSFLGIVNGAPQWSIPVGPGPEPEPEPNISLTNLLDKYQLFNEAYAPVIPLTPEAWLREQPTFNLEELKQQEGASIPSVRGNLEGIGPDTFSLTESFGKVLTVGWAMRWNGTFNTANPKPVITADDSNLQVITSKVESVIVGDGAEKWQWFWVSWLCNRAADTVNVSWSYSTQWMENVRFYLRYYALEDAGTYALQRQMAAEEELKALRGVIMDIDKQSQR